MVESGARLELSASKMEEVTRKVAEFIDSNSGVIAQKIKADTKNGTEKVTGNYARGVKARKSKYEDGGHIVLATAPHSFLVEYGTKGRRVPLGPKPLYSKKLGKVFGWSVAPMPALAPLRKALKKNIGFARQQFAQSKIDFEK